MSENKREIGDLEKEYINLVLGEQVSSLNDDLSEYVKEFVNRSFVQKELLEKLQSKANEIYLDTLLDKNRKTYLEIYESLLITEIRNLKIDKIC